MFIILRCLLVFLAIPLFCEDPYAIDHAIVSIYAVDSDTGKVLISKNSDLSMVPASCMKLVTTAAALELLGPDLCFETHMEYDGVINKGVLHGNIYIRGGGDPCLASDRLSGIKEQINTWADALQKLGISKVQGRIIADASKWEKARAVPSWAFEDLGNYYGAGASALSFHENFYTLYFKPGKFGEAAVILRTDPEIASLILQNEVKIGPLGSGDRACIYGSEISPIQCVRGTIPAGTEEFSIKGAIPDLDLCCLELVNKELQNRGVTIEGKEIAMQPRTPFHTTVSPTIKAIVDWTNQKSINLYAEHLLKKMGEVKYEEGSTDSGVKAVTEFWKSQGVDLRGFNMADGSGLSRKNLVTTKLLVEILLRMNKSKHFPEFYESLPQGKGDVRAKSGTMSLIKSYAGYSGSIVFAILINQCKDTQIMNQKIDEVIQCLLQFNKESDSSLKPLENSALLD